MDGCEATQKLQKLSALGSLRSQAVPAEKNNGVARRPKAREVSSRYRSPSPSIPSGPRRAISPGVSRTSSLSTIPAQKRPQSAERKRSSTPPSPRTLSTPVHDSSSEILLSNITRRITGGRLPESLWPSTMRSLSVSFQSDTFSVPVSKREKPAPHALSDRTLKPSSNIAYKQSETQTASRKATPERKRSPLKGKNASGQSENSKPVDTIPARLIDQHRWPSITGGKMSSNALNKSVDISDSTSRTAAMSLPGIGASSLRRLSIDGPSRPLHKSTSDTASHLLSGDRTRMESDAHIIHDKPLQTSGLRKPISTSSSGKMATITPTIRTQSLPSPGSRPASPSKMQVLSSSMHRGVSPSRPSTTPSRGVSPSRIRSISSSCQSSSSTSVLSFIAAYRKGKKGANHIEDAHLLRLLHNRHLQWRFTNARKDAAVEIQKITAEAILYNVWKTSLALWSSIIKKRINFLRLRLELKLNSVLNNQMPYLDHFVLFERDHSSSLSGVIEAMEASTTRVPVTGGAKADIRTVKAAICSAVDVMQAMGSSFCSLLPTVENMASLISGLAEVAARERAMLKECEALLASRASMQVAECSLRSHLIQNEQGSVEGKLPLFDIKMPP